MLGIYYSLPYLMWFEFFKLNNHYEDYCEAERTNNYEQLKLLRGSYSNIADLYEDWGDIFFDSKGKETNFVTWYKTHKTLFPPLIARPISILDRNSENDILGAVLKNCQFPPFVNRATLDHVPEDSTIICVPNQYPTKEALNKIREILEKLDSQGLRVNAKYHVKNLHQWSEETNKAMWKRLLVARYDRCSHSNNESTDMSNLEIVKSMINDYKSLWPIISGDDSEPIHCGEGELPFELDDYELEELSTSLRSIDAQNQIRQVKRWRKQANIIIENTIHGVFPIHKQTDQ